jgi:hypothetical protein
MRTPLIRLLLLCAALLASQSAKAEDQLQEGLWEITVRMEVAGQPATTAPLVVRQCINQQSAQDLMTQLTGAAGGCQVSDLRQEGNRARWNLTCSGQIELTGTGDVTITAGGFDGTLNAMIAMGGTPVPIMQTFGARRVGECQ